MPFNGYPGGVAPGAELIICKVVEKQDKVEIKTILKALKYLEEVSKGNKIHVISMSLGFPEADNPTPNQRNMRDLRTTITRLKNKGIICVAAAGNGGTHPENHPVFCPARFDCTMQLDPMIPIGLGLTFLLQVQRLTSQRLGKKCAYQRKTERRDWVVCLAPQWRLQPLLVS